jgi:hypothetical protein
MGIAPRDVRRLVHARHRCAKGEIERSADKLALKCGAVTKTRAQWQSPCTRESGERARCIMSAPLSKYIETATGVHLQRLTRRSTTSIHWSM